MDRLLAGYRDFALLAHLTPEEMTSIAALFVALPLSAGMKVFSEGDRGTELYLILSGKIAITSRVGKGRERVIAEMGPGEFFGEMSIFENEPRSATCMAREESLLFVLRGADLFSMMRHHPGIAVKIMTGMMRIISGRLQSISGFLNDMITWGQDARKRAISDAMTGVYNRAYFEEAAPDYLQAARQSGRPLCVVMLDLDHFRQINERLGHSAGDRAIMGIVQVFRSGLREKDLIARYGGDEFTMLLPDTPAPQAVELLNGVRRAVNKKSLWRPRDQVRMRLSTSMGIAVFPGHSDSLEGLRKIADNALYMAKEGGRNRVVLHP